jgi:hypothetical protein
LCGAVAKLASINLRKLVLNFSYWFDKPWFHTEERLVAVLIIPSSWGSQLGGHLHAIKREVEEEEMEDVHQDDMYIEG